MNKTVVIVLAVIVAAAVAVGLAMKLAKPGPAQPAKAEAKASAKAPSEAAARPAAPAEPPYWNAGNLGGTDWTGQVSGIDIKIAFISGGTLKVTSDNQVLKSLAPSGEIPGTWSIDGSKFTIQIDVPKMGAKKLSGTISGKQFLDDKGKPLSLQQAQ